MTYLRAMRHHLFLLVLLGASIPLAGCGDSCEELAERCVHCSDADYKADCEEVVAGDVQNTCDKKKALFDAYCPDVSEDSTSTTTSTGSAGGAGATGGTAGAGGL